ncbi:hypothetical protein AQUCO_03500170v1 [Aquilegia coerulea]|uniref:Protein kinase domain-containing protein n=1 Tax=Aquilegia coerulea TaxID=218851 RepID=A0A2G5CWH7_AQUCA|nr:hypothetical protein AQUCO_03500170v1 [Aquilegia coerulea]
MKYLSLWIWLVVAYTVAAENKTVELDCPSRCGNLSISYPFGIGRKGCYRDEGFEILCSKNGTTFVPYLGINHAQVLNLTNNRVHVRGWSSATINNCNGPQASLIAANLSSSPFTISNTHNRLSAFGCNILGYITNSSIDRNYVSGCVSLCNSDSVMNKGSACSGINGCCTTTIPSGLKAFELQVNSINTQTKSSRDSDHFNCCSIAVIEDGNFLRKVKSTYITSALKYPESHASIVLDWAIGVHTCKEAKRNAANFECRSEHSECFDSANGPGYRCRCLEGYQGNPYLHNGCQDIDECKGQHKCIKEAHCVNIIGSYHCECPYGYSDDGGENGLGCRPSNLQDRRITRQTIIGIGIGVGSGLLVLPIVGYWLYRELRKSNQTKLKQRNFKRNGGLLLQQQIHSRDNSVDITKIFVAEELKKASDNFNESRILGRGGSGTVYKGMVSDGRIVAIKKSRIVDDSQMGQFINELVILSQINHRNVVKLLGCCLETEVPLLVYEYISNGTLSDHLHNTSLIPPISWARRVQVSIEIAGALSYLHSSASTPIFHRDIKSSNILLDEHYRAKVSDFGISRSVPYDQSHLTTIVQGTFGYLDPEYFHSGQFTDKSDVYSFGVVLVELLTGQKPIFKSKSVEEKSLAMHFIDAVKQGRLFQVIDSLVLNEAKKEEVILVAELAKRCLKLVGKKRPTMKEVMAELEGLCKFPEQTCIAQIIPQETMLIVEGQSRLSTSSPETTYQETISWVED